MHKRLGDHAASIEQVENLDLKDFKCRFLVVDDIWIPLAESLLIEMFSPLWNSKLTGFGNHDPGSGRYKQKRSFWDTIHPGRRWAYKLQPSNFEVSSIRQTSLGHIEYAIKKDTWGQD
jgi:hypothetical protein